MNPFQEFDIYPLNDETTANPRKGEEQNSNQTDYVESERVVLPKEAFFKFTPVIGWIYPLTINYSRISKDCNDIQTIKFRHHSVQDRFSP